ncbi:hypothetical protein LSH36_997g02003 [Paralvinella palmiformis]|uniref:Chloride channel protein n=1 Tax=Paralvinella palmiformis TaxID=53620 RepID=A0AAD9MQV4_9ANNE|nr:hypothetical protein LSH36_997g02003 [Paralvinella palmiformis]
MFVAPSGEFNKNRTHQSDVTMADRVGDRIRSGTKTLNYDETLMFGRYSKELGAFARQSADEIRKQKENLQGRRAPPEPSSSFKYYTETKCVRCKRSGIPEMKTILRGVVLKEYLTLRTLISKIVGLCTSLGCGLPIGKEGPFVHVASIAATLLGKLITPFHGIFENQSRNSEMLAAACAVGVACTFAAPIGGVLFSIEVTATYFAVRNYWRGFYSAVCGAMVFRLLAVWFRNEETLTALFKTDLRQEFPFDSAELLAFSFVGIICGIAGALFVYTHRKFVEFIRKQKKVSNFLQQNRFLYPCIVTFITVSLMFPPGLGQFMAGHLSNHRAVNELFSNWTWSIREPENFKQAEILASWAGPQDNIFLTLALFTVVRFPMAALANTLPVPAGVFIPVFTIGAAFGRLVGEAMAVLFPEGFSGHLIIPAGYAIVGAAALSGSVTHTISTSVIVFELTGQMGHVLPCVIAVILSNAVAHRLQPSFYDSMILIKNLPYLPDIVFPPSDVDSHKVYVEDFMVRDVKCLTPASTYVHAIQLLEDHEYRTFPLVDSIENMLLLGSIHRAELHRLIDKQISEEAMDAFFEMLSRERIKLSHIKAAQQTPNVENASQEDTTVPPVHKPSQASQSSRRSRFSVSRVAEDEVQPTETKPEVFQRAESVTSDSSDFSDICYILDQLPTRKEDLTPEQLRLWENYQLLQKIDFDQCIIDRAPFQLVEGTSLFKVHSLFSLLSLHHSYVTNTGRLVGMVAMEEVRQAVQGQIQYRRNQPHKHSGCLQNESVYDGISKGPFQSFSAAPGKLHTVEEEISEA